MTSGIVKTEDIGQSAGLLSYSAMIGYERVSETAKISVDNEGLINPNWLKVQSDSLLNSMR